jgi:PKD repeat protein
MASLSSNQIKAQCPIPNACTPGAASNPQAGLFGGGIFQVTMGTFVRNSPGASEGYVDNCVLGTINITLGSPQSFTIRTGNTFSENLRIFIDVNNDQVFTAPGELFYSSNNAKVHTGNLLIPSATTGVRVKMRISSDLITAAAVPGPCTTPEYSQVEDYAVEFQQNVAPPIPLFKASDTITCNGTVSFTDQSLNNPNSWMWDFGDGQTSTNQNPTHTYTSSGSYSVKLKVGNVNGFDSLTKQNYVRYNDTIPVPPSCPGPPTLNHCCGYGISRFAFNSIDNSSTLGSYQDFTCALRTRVLQGRSYPVSIGTNPNQDQDTRIWIDYNNNGAFETSELVFESLGSRNPVGNILISSDTAIKTGKPLRMRIVSEFTGGATTPCTALDKGQCEDYTIYIFPNTLPPVANFVVTTSNFCQPTVTFQSTSINSIFGYLWNFGDGNDSLTSTPSVSYTYQTPGSFNVSLKVFGPFGVDSILKINAASYNFAPVNACNLTTQAGGPQGAGIARVTFGTIDRRSGGFSEGYQNFTCTSQTKIKRGQTLPLTVRNTGQFTEKVQAWIDWNGNGAFENATERVLNSSGDTVHTAQILVPANASTSGAIRMRVASNIQQAGQFGSCGNIQVGQAEDYGIVVLENTVPPLSLFGANQTSTCTGIVQFSDSSENIPSAFKWFFGDGDSSVLQSPLHTYQTTGSFTVTLITSNQFGSDTLVKTNFITVTQTTGMVPTSCAAANTNTCCNYGIAQVSFAGINKTSGNATEGNKDFTCESIGSAPIGTQQTITIVNSGQNSENVSVWIDWNNDGSFGSNELAFSSLSATTHAGNITIPGNAQAGIGLRIRVKSDFTAQPLTGPCGAIQFGQYEDYQLVLQGNNQAPIALFTSNTTLTCGKTVSFSDTSFNAPSSWKWYFGDGDSSTARNPIHTYSSTGTFSVKLIVSNANGSDTLEKLNYIQILDNGNLKPAPCTPQTQNTINNQGVGISSVSFGTISRTSPIAPIENYVDGACQFRTEVTIGNTYPITINTGPQFGESCRVWIDWNNNGTFEDPAERVLNSQNSNTHFANILVPNSAKTDTLLRMRVISDVGGGPGGNIAPCSNPFFGQCEDYGVLVKPNQQPPVAQIQGNTIISCNGWAQFRDASTNVPISWRWEFGDGNFSTLQNPSHQYAAIGAYNIKLKVRNAFGVDSIQLPSFVNVTSFSGPKPPQCITTTAAPGNQSGTTRVRFGNMDKTSGLASVDGGYVDYTCSDSARIIVTSIGQTFPLIINTSAGPNRENLRVYIDFNNDGIFQTTESVFQSTNQIQHTINLTFTADQALDIPVRMRIITDNRFTNINNACYNPAAGQVEDYTVRIAFIIANLDLNQSSGVEVFPNPSKGIFSIKTEENIESLSLTDLQGKSIPLPERTGINDKSLDLRAISEGIYLLHLKTNRGVSRQKIIIQK